MIYKGDIVILRNPTERGLKYVPHMHVVESVLDGDHNYKRKLAVCTTNPLKYIKKKVPFLQVSENPFKEKTYIRLDPMYSIENVRIKAESRTSPCYRLSQDTEKIFFSRINGVAEKEMDKQEFLNINKRYASSI